MFPLIAADMSADLRKRDDATAVALSRGKPERAGDVEYRQGGLAAAAAAAGSYVRTVPYRPREPPSTLGELVKLSEVICIGVAYSNRSYLVQQGRSISMVLEVHCSDVLKGTLERPMVNIVIPGGRVAFGQAIAEVKVLDFPLPTMNSRTVWFLQRAAAENATLPRTDNTNSTMFEPSSGPLAIYDLELKRVRPNGASRTRLAKRITAQRLSGITFVDAVRTAIQRPVG